MKLNNIYNNKNIKLKTKTKKKHQLNNKTT
jgi:hypothetical protein